ncbi:hypothetical protein GUITHDRAFT_72832 [Guillardia theta CCMP2712]|uniref:Thiaminase-2/PQQC domain-containing protein n=1 Tax=Guillardia theta (strain CCMP2712) TaxID=905079 RepID=L1J656_GUITC|nr:hypothetical protein GUITHDRAFT_72832 [Guillardia theta CCMP2712]EKX43777.1 hypothetical protein GUITHDRAFT_72832 [Guillardia theta CCMP2712]|eukprot:XP_005830757.1 hypothetical protein GUITHDRAFT_72832 [Guillardia theta CCMP2712]
MRTSVSFRLFTETLPIATRCLYHPFVSGIAQGSLKKSSFQNYVAQDAFFLRGFADAYSMARQIVSDNGDSPGAEKFHTLYNGVQEELRMHSSYAQKWNVDLTNVTPNKSTQDYVDFVMEIAKKDSKKISLICASLTPCMRLYAWLGSKLGKARFGENNIYVEWINTYSSDEFEELAKTLEDLLDDYATKESTDYEVSGSNPNFRVVST